MNDFIKPNLIIAGFPKCGTTSLHDFLVKSRKIHGGLKKEPHTFTFEDRYENRFNLKSKYSFYQLYSNVVTFDKGDYVIDSSTTYMISTKALKRIAKDNQATKIIIIVRDPIKRIESHYNWLKSLGWVDRSFYREIKDEISKKFNPLISYGGNFKNYVEFSKYGQQIERLFEIFDKKNVLILSLEKIGMDWETCLNDINEFLGTEIPYSSFPKSNETHKVAKVESQIFKRKLRKIPFKILRKLIWRLHVKTRKNNNKYVKLDYVLKKYLHELLNDDIKKFKKLVELDVKWEYVDEVEQLKIS